LHNGNRDWSSDVCSSDLRVHLAYSLLSERTAARGKSLSIANSQLLS
jgi:hypothetical protein